MLNRRIRNLATLALSITALIAGLALTAGPASAAANPCTSGCFLQNLYTSSSGSGLYIYGTGHNQDLRSSFDNGDGFLFTFKSGNWGIIQDENPASGAVGECWNTNGTAIGLDSCPAGDTNEYFQFVQDGNYWLIESDRTGQYIAADRNGNPIYFTTGVNDTSLWAAF